MICRKCGKENPEGTNFCRYCGNMLPKDMTVLIERAKRNDQAAISEIYWYSSSELFRAIKVLVKDEDTVNDILQDTYIKAFKRLDQLQNPDRLIPWLKAIANNTAKDWLKKKKPLLFSEISNQEETNIPSFVEIRESIDVDVNPEMAVDEKEVRKLVMEILDQLPEDQRMVVGMFYYEELSVKEIAETLDLSENTVKSRLMYGRRKIKEQVLELEKQGTKLYNVAPFVFFLYLLRRMESAPAELSETQALQGIIEYGAASQISETTAKKAVSKAAVGTATKTAAKHAGTKVASLILAGVVGAGGVGYVVVKNADKLPFGQETMKVEMAQNSPADQNEQLNDEEDTEDATQPVKEIDVDSVYRDFYEKYIEDENLLVIQDGEVSEYDYYNGYDKDMLLGAYMEDFGGDDNKELLLVRTTGTPVEKPVENSPATVRKLQVELYGIDEQEVTLKQSLEVSGSNLNDSSAYVKEQLAVKKEEGSYRLYRYGMYHASAGAGVYFNTFVDITDDQLIERDNMDYLLGGTYGWCKVNGIDHYTQNQEADKAYLNEVLSNYGMQAFEELDLPLITGVNREEKNDGHLYWNVTFEIQNCFASSNITGTQHQQEPEYPAMKSGYYSTILNANATSGVPPYYTGRITSVEYDENSITFYGSFNRGDELPFTSNAETFVEDGKYTFELTPQTEYYGNEQEDYYSWTKESALQACQGLNGLEVILKVTDGKIEKMTFYS